MFYSMLQFHAPSNFVSYDFFGCVASPAAARIKPYNRPNTTMPAISHELLITAVQMVCYFCTAVGIALTFLFGVRT
jgi:hypothetical protein